MNLHHSTAALFAIALTHCFAGDPKGASPPRAIATEGGLPPGSYAHLPAVPPQRAGDVGATEVVGFWRDAGPALWFAKQPEFDRRFREAFASLFARAASGELDGWLAAPDSALALVLLLDQYPRNSFRGTPRMYATDEVARQAADAAITRGHDRAVEAPLQMFFYLPFAHSESLDDQERSVSLARRLRPVDLAHAEHHRDIVKRFGRFPHRNVILGRQATREESAYLADGGYAG